MDNPIVTAPIVTVCPACRKLNRIPAARLAEKPNCGACGKALFDGHPVDVDNAGFDRHATGDLPVLVDVWAPWCGPCRAMAPMFVRAAGLLEPHVRLLKLNLDDAPDIGRRFGIQSVPTLLLLDRGRFIAQTAGAMDTDGIVAWVRQNARTAAP